MPGLLDCNFATAIEYGDQYHLFANWPAYQILNLSFYLSIFLPDISDDFWPCFLENLILLFPNYPGFFFFPLSIILFYFFFSFSWTSVGKLCNQQDWLRTCCMVLCLKIKSNSNWVGLWTLHYSIAKRCTVIWIGFRRTHAGASNTIMACFSS